MLTRRDMMAAAVSAGLAASPLRAAMRFDAAAKGFDLASAGTVTPVYVDSGDHAGVRRAARGLAVDIGRVTGTEATLLEKPVPDPGAGKRLVLIGTLGRSPTIDALAAAGQIDVAPIRGKWESYTLRTVRNPLPGVAEALVIVGSDKRGTIYGIYDLSQNIGVAPALPRPAAGDVLRSSRVPLRLIHALGRQSTSV